MSNGVPGVVAVHRVVTKDLFERDQQLKEELPNFTEFSDAMQGFYASKESRASIVDAHFFEGSYPDRLPDPTGAFATTAQKITVVHWAMVKNESWINIGRTSPGHELFGTPYTQFWRNVQEGQRSLPLHLHTEDILCCHLDNDFLWCGNVKMRISIPQGTHVLPIPKYAQAFDANFKIIPGEERLTEVRLFPGTFEVQNVIERGDDVRQHELDWRALSGDDKVQRLANQKPMELTVVYTGPRNDLPSGSSTTPP